jgi:hypothetical protein
MTILFWLVFAVVVGPFLIMGVLGSLALLLVVVGLAWSDILEAIPHPKAQQASKYLYETFGGKPL